MEHRNNISVSVQPQIGIFLSLFIILVPLRWVFAWLFALLFHEVCHVLMIILCRKRIYSADISVRGVILRTEALSLFQNALCSFAGPAGGLLFLPLARWFPRLAMCALVQSAYNLLPIRPLDGSHIVSAIGCIFFGDAIAERIVSVAEYVVLFTLISCCLYLTVVCKMGLLPLAFAAILLFRRAKIKIPCKEAVHRVQ